MDDLAVAAASAPRGFQATALISAVAFAGTGQVPPESAALNGRFPPVPDSVA